MNLVQSIVITAPMVRVFDLVRSVDAHTATSSGIGGLAVGGRTSGLAQVGDVTVWSARFFGLRFKLATRVTALESPQRMTELLERGLFSEFGHCYTLRSLQSSAVELTDTFNFRSPLGVIGAQLDELMLKPVMTRAMTARLEGLKRIAEGNDWQRFLPESLEIK